MDLKLREWREGDIETLREWAQQDEEIQRQLSTVAAPLSDRTLDAVMPRRGMVENGKGAIMMVAMQPQGDSTAAVHVFAAPGAKSLGEMKQITKAYDLGLAFVKASGVRVAVGAIHDDNARARRMAESKGFERVPVNLFKKVL